MRAAAVLMLATNAWAWTAPRIPRATRAAPRRRATEEPATPRPWARARAEGPQREKPSPPRRARGARREDVSQTKNARRTARARRRGARRRRTPKRLRYAFPLVRRGEQASSGTPRRKFWRRAEPNPRSARRSRLQREPLVRAGATRWRQSSRRRPTWPRGKTVEKRRTRRSSRRARRRSTTAERKWCPLVLALLCPSRGRHAHATAAKISGRGPRLFEFRPPQVRRAARRRRRRPLFPRRPRGRRALGPRAVENRRVADAARTVEPSRHRCAFFRSRPPLIGFDALGPTRSACSLAARTCTCCRATSGLSATRRSKRRRRAASARRASRSSPCWRGRRAFFCVSSPVRADARPRRAGRRRGQAAGVPRLPAVARRLLHVPGRDAAPGVPTRGRRVTPFVSL